MKDKTPRTYNSERRPGKDMPLYAMKTKGLLTEEEYLYYKALAKAPVPKMETGLSTVKCNLSFDMPGAPKVNGRASTHGNW
jgi:hypothetical protein